MKRLTCEMCGSTDLIKQDGVFVCQSCGCKYSVEEAKKMMVEGTVEVTGTVKVDQSASIENYLSMAKNAMESNNYEEAEKYANRIIEIDPKNALAWEIKAKASGWQSKTNNNRLGESISAWINAVDYTEEEKRSELRARISDDFANLLFAMISLRAGNFERIHDTGNKDSLVNDFQKGIEMLNTLTVRAGVSFDRAVIYNAIIRRINSSAEAAFIDAAKEFGPDHSDMVQWKFERFIESGDACISLLESVVDYVYDSALGAQICKNAMQIGEAVRDSKSYKFNVHNNAYDHYEVDRYFTADAKKLRTQNIENFSLKRSMFLENRLEKTLELSSGSRKASEVELAKTKYWEEHSDEKEHLEAERAELLENVSRAQKEIESVPSLELYNDVMAAVKTGTEKIEELNKKMAGLGMFKGKEKKALQEEINEVRTMRHENEMKADALKSNVEIERAPLEKEIAEAKVRLAEIENELTKERGRVSEQTHAFIEGAVVDGKLRVTPKELVAFLKDHLPAPYGLEEMDRDKCMLHDSLTDLFHVNMIDNSLQSDNKNAGLFFYMDADGEDQPCRSIILGTNSSKTYDSMAKFAVLGSELILALMPTMSRDDAEKLALTVLIADNNCLFNFDGLRFEAAQSRLTLLQSFKLDYNYLLIREA